MNPDLQQSTEQVRAHMHSAAQLLALPISATQEPGVLQNLQRIAAMASLVNEFVLDEDIEPAPIFKHE